MSNARLVGMINSSCFDSIDRLASKAEPAPPTDFTSTKAASIDTAESAQSEESKTILLVEDEAFVRNATSEVLQASGYKVISAANAIDAWNLCTNSVRTIDLLLADIVMPGMSGVELAEKFRRLHTESRVLLMSGHAAEFSRWASSPFREMQLNKPFTVDVLLAVVRSALRPTFATLPAEPAGERSIPIPA
jgi:two-component system, cell cycle sensor histidine kinase and response regulator CckA